MWVALCLGSGFGWKGEEDIRSEAIRWWRTNDSASNQTSEDNRLAISGERRNAWVVGAGVGADGFSAGKLVAMGGWPSGDLDMSRP